MGTDWPRACPQVSMMPPAVGHNSLQCCALTMSPCRPTTSLSSNLKQLYNVHLLPLEEVRLVTEPSACTLSAHACTLRRTRSHLCHAGHQQWQSAAWQRITAPLPPSRLHLQVVSQAMHWTSLRHHCMLIQQLSDICTALLYVSLGMPCSACLAQPCQATCATACMLETESAPRHSNWPSPIQWQQHRRCTTH